MPAKSILSWYRIKNKNGWSALYSNVGVGDTDNDGGTTSNPIKNKNMCFLKG